MAINEERENFFVWTKLKIKLHLSEVRRFPKEKEIWWASLGQNIGVEINGKNKNFERPVLVVTKYNKDAMLVLPISSKIKTGSWCFKFINNDNKENMINLSQLKMISSKRFIRKIWNMDSVVYRQIKEKLKELI